MGSFFVIGSGVCIWLAVIGVMLIGMATEIDDIGPGTATGADGPGVVTGADGSAPATKLGGLGSATIRVIALSAAGTLCMGFALVNALMHWGVVALATYTTLLLGSGVTAAGVAFRHANGQNWHEIPTPFIGGAVSCLVALVAFGVAMPGLSTLEYEEYSYGTEARALEYDRTPAGAYLVRKHGKNYMFRYSHRIGDVLGNRRYIIDKKQVVFLDEDSSSSSYVEGEVTAMAKLDPISGRPLETRGGKTFRPITLYVLPSDIQDARAA